MLTWHEYDFDVGKTFVTPSSHKCILKCSDSFRGKLAADEHHVQQIVMYAIEELKRQIAAHGIENFLSRICEVVDPVFTSFEIQDFVFASFGVRILVHQDTAQSTDELRLVDYDVDLDSGSGPYNDLPIFPAAFIASLGNDSPFCPWYGGANTARKISSVVASSATSQSRYVSLKFQSSLLRDLFVGVTMRFKRAGSTESKFLFSRHAIEVDRMGAERRLAHRDGTADDFVLSALLAVTGDRALSASRRIRLVDGLCRFASLGDNTGGELLAAERRLAHRDGTADDFVLSVLLAVTGDRALSASRRIRLVDGLCRFASLGDNTGGELLAAERRLAHRDGTANDFVLSVLLAVTDDRALSASRRIRLVDGLCRFASLDDNTGGNLLATERHGPRNSIIDDLVLSALLAVTGNSALSVRRRITLVNSMCRSAISSEDRTEGEQTSVGSLGRKWLRSGGRRIDRTVTRLVAFVRGLRDFVVLLVRSLGR